MLLELSTLIPLLNTCQSQFDASILQHLIDNESSRNPYAIGVVGANTVNQPQNLEEAIQVATHLEQEGFNFSLGLMQINKKNFPAYGLTIESAFDACSNIEVGADIYAQCYHRAKQQSPDKTDHALLEDAASCYYRDNFLRNYRANSALNINHIDKFNHAKKLHSDVISESYDSQPESSISTPPNTPKQNHSWDVFGDFSY